MKCFVVNPQFNGYSLYVHIKYHTVMMKVILYGRLCSIEHCFHCDILLRHGMSHSINAERLTVTLRAIHKVCTLKYSKYLTLSPPCTQYNKRITSLKQQRYSFAQTTLHLSLRTYFIDHPLGYIYLFKVNNRNTRIIREICSKLTIRMMSLLLTLNNFTNSSSVYTVDFQHENVGWVSFNKNTVFTYSVEQASVALAKLQGLPSRHLPAQS